MPALHEQVKTLKKTTTALKRENTRLSNANAKLNKIISEYGPQSTVKDLQMQLDASEERANVLDDNNQALLELVDDLTSQIGHFQKLIQHTAAVTVWKTQ